SLPEDVKEYVSRDFVTKVRLVQSANNKQRLVLTNSALSEMSSAVSPRMNLEILMSRLLCEKEDRLSSSKDSHKIQEKKPSGFVQKQRK
ncbi:hypothetical protein, partial [Gardnerella sp. KA00735]|uniref:hypothetical protein n=1 Tax=Gardnerella sp. KA00735 TaxID=1973156 RepID=UPI000CBF2957